MTEFSHLYAKAGVNTLEGQKFVEKIKPFALKTLDRNVLSGIGGFSSIYDLSFLKDYKNPVLITSTDGVGTKLSYASYLKRFDTIGYDLVAMCANDILVTGARSRIFLDYIATGKLNSDEMSLVIRSIASACRMIDVSLLGGETAEHPRILKENDFDLAGFMIGFAEKEELIDNSKIEEGDIIIGVPSSGIHSNGISLIRNLFFDPSMENSLEMESEVMNFLKNEILLQPTILYEILLREFLQERIIYGLVHITGGGYQENVPRILNRNQLARFRKWNLLEPFLTIQKKANTSFEELSKVLNLGYGMLVITKKEFEKEIIEKIKDNFLQYRQKYKSLQMEFFSEFKEWENDWNLQFILQEPRIIGVIEKSNSEKPAVIFE